MIYIRPEGGVCRKGLNIYPWSERKTSVGFLLIIKRWMLVVRWAPHVRKFYFYSTRTVV